MRSAVQSGYNALKYSAYSCTAKIPRKESAAHKRRTTRAMSFSAQNTGPLESDSPTRHYLGYSIGGQCTAQETAGDSKNVTAQPLYWAAFCCLGLRLTGWVHIDVELMEMLT